eukprot:14281371-Heterocapsa_arctica.AAC.1
MELAGRAAILCKLQRMQLHNAHRLSVRTDLKQSKQYLVLFVPEKFVTVVCFLLLEHSVVLTPFVLVACSDPRFPNC